MASSSTSSNLLIKAENIHLRLNGTLVLDHISLQMHEGDIITLIGPNGSGKTTLSRVLLGLQPIDGGNLYKRPDLHIGYMPQTLFIDRVLPLTVRRFLRIMPNKIHLRSPETVEAYAEKTGISHLLSHQIHDISGGELQRVLLTRALLRKPDLMILDEPIQGMDIHAQAEFYRLLESLQKEQQCAILMISHDLHMVMASSSKVICMNHHICCEGYPEEISNHPEYLSLFSKKDAASLAMYKHTHNHTHDASHHECTHHEKGDA